MRVQVLALLEGPLIERVALAIARPHTAGDYVNSDVSVRCIYLEDFFLNFFSSLGIRFLSECVFLNTALHMRHACMHVCMRVCVDF